MNKSLLVNLLSRMNQKWFFLLIILVQVIFIFQGLDFDDAGFHAEFYRRIFSDPTTVQYNFMWWFTGILGGLWIKFFPGLGLLGLRLFGVILTTLTLWLSYRLLRKYVQELALRLSFLLILLLLATAIKEMNYDDVSALFFVCAGSSVFYGLTKEKYALVFLAGVFISLNTFSRVPNVLGLALIASIWFYGWLNKQSFRQVIIQSVIFISGFLCMSLLLFMLMKALHHVPIYQACLKVLKKVGSSKENTHNVYAMAKMYIQNYSRSLMLSVAFLAALWVVAAGSKKLKTLYPRVASWYPYAKFLTLLILTAIFIYRAKKDPIFWFYLYFFYAGTCLIIGFLLITGNQKKELRLLAAIGSIMLLVMPLGSNYVLITVGKYAVWIILPLAVDYLLNIQTLSSRLVIRENSQHLYEEEINAAEINNLRNACIYLTLVFALAVAYFYPYFDQANRAQMRYAVHNDHLRGIYTTEARAQVVNELLDQSVRYVKPGDYVLAYDNLPMFYFVTDTRPYMHNSWPWLYDGFVFKEELYRSLQETGVCPVVIMQKRGNQANNWPDNHDEKYEFKPESLSYMQDFMKTYHYTQVWENDFFKIYTPASPNPAIAAAPIP